MTTTVTDLTSRILAYQFSSARYSDTGYILTLINEAQQDVVRKAKLRGEEGTATITTSSGDNTETLPTDFSSLIHIHNTDSDFILEKLGLRDYDDLISETGEPWSYVIIGSSIYWYPIPDGIYNLELRYYKLPANLSSSGTTELPTDFDDAIVNYVVWKLHEMEHDYEASQYHKNEYMDQLNKIMGQGQRDTNSGPKIIPGTWRGFE